MSVYSGFATRQQEQFYNKLIEKALKVMGERLISFYKNEKNEVDEIKWGKQLRKIYKYLALMEKAKHLEPRFSDSLYSLSAFLKEHLELDRQASTDSNLSMFLDNRSEFSLRMHQQHSTSIFNPCFNNSNSVDLTPTKSPHLLKQLTADDSSRRRLLPSRSLQKAQRIAKHTRTSQAIISRFNGHEATIRNMPSRGTQHQRSELGQQERGQANIVIDNQEVKATSGERSKRAAKWKGKEGATGVKKQTKSQLIEKLMMRKAQNLSTFDPMKQGGIDSQGYIVEKQEEEDELNSQRGLSNSPQQIIRQKNLFMESTSEVPLQTSESNDLHQQMQFRGNTTTYMTNNTNNKYKTQIRKPYQKFVEKEQLPDISQAGRKSSNRPNEIKLFKQRKNSSKSAQSSRSQSQRNKRKQTSIKSRRTNRRLQLEQNYGSQSQIPPPDYYQHNGFSTDNTKKFRNKYLKNVMQVDSHQIIYKPCNYSSLVEDNHYTPILTAFHRGSRRHKSRPNYPQNDIKSQPDFIF